MSWADAVSVGVVVVVVEVDVLVGDPVIIWERHGFKASMPTSFYVDGGGRHGRLGSGGLSAGIRHVWTVPWSRRHGQCCCSSSMNKSRLAYPSAGAPIRTGHRPEPPVSSGYAQIGVLGTSQRRPCLSQP